MEYENKYASKGVAGAGLGLGIAGTALGLGVLNGGIGNIFGGRSACSEDHCVNRYEFGLQQEIAAKDARIGLLESNIYTDSKIADVYEKLNAKIGGVEAQIAAQAVYNATNTATINCISGQVAQLMSLTKLVVPNTSICPGWGDVTVSVTPAPTTAG
jgi:hypothetical protein